jgi:hypothetical protein
MKRLHVAVASAVIVLVPACDRAPPPDLLRMADSGALRASPRDAGAAWSRALCAPLPESVVGASLGGLTLTGECPLHIAQPVQCLSRGDDFYVEADRPLEGDRLLKLFVNVESFVGPGEYPHKVEIRVLVKDGATLYQWMQYEATATLGAAARTSATITQSASAVSFVVFPHVSLHAAPGTPTSGLIELEGTAACEPPGTANARKAPAP